MIIPTKRFFLELASACVAWGQWLCAEQPNFSLWFQNFFGFVSEPEDMNDAEWFTPPCMTEITHAEWHISMERECVCHAF